MTGFDRNSLVLTDDSFSVTPFKKVPFIECNDFKLTERYVWSDNLFCEIYIDECILYNIAIVIYFYIEYKIPYIDILLQWESILKLMIS